MREVILGIIVCLGIIVISYLGIGTLASYQCKARFDSVGKTSWGPLQGCKVEYKGRMIPASMLRETN